MIISTADSKCIFLPLFSVCYQRMTFFQWYLHRKNSTVCFKIKETVVQACFVDSPLLAWVRGLSFNSHLHSLANCTFTGARSAIYRPVQGRGSIYDIKSFILKQTIVLSLCDCCDLFYRAFRFPLLLLVCPLLGETLLAVKAKGKLSFAAGSVFSTKAWSWAVFCPGSFPSCHVMTHSSPVYSATNTWTVLKKTFGSIVQNLVVHPLEAATKMIIKARGRNLWCWSCLCIRACVYVCDNLNSLAKSDWSEYVRCICGQYL